jgi:hypothetical protein
MGKVYLTNTFSLNMLKPLEGEVKFKPVSDEEVKEILNKGFVSYISHASTAQVLKKLLGINAELNRSNLVLEDGDTLVVFQIGVRPKEGQVFSEEELEEIVKNKLYRFWIVNVNYKG